MYQVIARKYRPQSFADLIGQSHVRTTIENAISQQRIAHGYIFSGQRGTGKTTVARILARCLNCERGPTIQPCGVCASCLEVTAGNSVDVIEIDAASNRGINEMRELRENVRYRPARDRYKVFIVDEAHQITSEAFNALLKTLEEPPEWVVFILCTTEAHKIPTTIASRCQQFSFRSVDFQELVARMTWICGQEGIQTDPEVLAVLAQVGEGSVRDSLSALDQAIACCGGVLSPDEVRHLLGMFSLQTMERVSEHLLASNSKGVLEVVLDMESNGKNLQHFCRELARYFRNLLVAKVAGGEPRLLAASQREIESYVATAARFSEEDLTRYLQLTLELFKDLQFSLQPRLHVEMGLLRLVNAGKLLPIEEALASLGPPDKTPAIASRPAEKAAPAPAPARPAGPTPLERDAARKATPAPTATGPIDWKPRLEATLMELGMPFTADAVEHSEVREVNGEIQFITPKGFLLNAKDVAKAIQQIAGRPMKAVLTVGSPDAPVSKPQSTTVSPKSDAPENAASERALSHPEVQSFQEMFPDAHVRTVRDLKE